MQSVEQVVTETVESFAKSRYLRVIGLEGRLVSSYQGSDGPGPSPPHRFLAQEIHAELSQPDHQKELQSIYNKDGAIGVKKSSS